MTVDPEVDAERRWHIVREGGDIHLPVWCVRDLLAQAGGPNQPTVGSSARRESAWRAFLRFAKESFGVRGPDTVVPAWQPYGFEFSVADPTVYGADGNMQDVRDLGDSEQVFVA